MHDSSLLTPDAWNEAATYGTSNIFSQKGCSMALADFRQSHNLHRQWSILRMACVPRALPSMFLFSAPRRLNAPVLQRRCDPEHQKVITLLCKTTLEFHGFGVEEMQSKVCDTRLVPAKQGCWAVIHGIRLMVFTKRTLLSLFSLVHVSKPMCTSRNSIDL
jgi:hypothetical protein